MTTPLSAVLVIAIVAALAPLIAEAPVRVRPPIVVVEVLFGIVVGPHALALATADGLVGYLGRLGLIFLFFLAGLEIDLTRVRGRPLWMASLGWLLSLALGLAIARALVPSGFVHAPILIGIALTTTALGTLLPILRDAGELNSDFGTYILAAGAAGEFFPVLVLSLLFSRDEQHAAEPVIMIGFSLLAVLTAFAALSARTPRIVKMLSRGMRTSSQLPVRLCILIMVALAALAERFGLDVVLGAFAGGMVVGLALHEHREALLHEKLDAIGFGFLIPMFFVTSGMQIDLPSLIGSASAMMRVPVFLALFLFVRGTPALFYRRELLAPDRLAFALYSATALPLVVAIAQIGVDTGRMRRDNAAALVTAGMFSLMLFPVIALSRRRVAHHRARQRAAAKAN